MAEPMLDGLGEEEKVTLSSLAGSRRSRRLPMSAQTCGGEVSSPRHGHTAGLPRSISNAKLPTLNVRPKSAKTKSYQLYQRLENAQPEGKSYQL
jgi:hypothetical protein